jgi:hypothetical protein
MSMSKTYLHLILTLALTVSGSLGCTTVPSTQVTQMTKAGDLLYVMTGEGVIKSFKVKGDSFSLADRLEFPNMNYAIGTTTPTIRNIITSKQDFIIDAYQANAFPRETNIYHIKDGTIEIIGNLPYSTYLIAADKRYFYGIDSERYFANNNISFQNNRIKYDRDLKINSAAHIEDRKLTVMDSWDDNNFYWYACTDADNIDGSRFAGKVASIKRAVLVRVDKQSNEYREFTIDEELSLCHISDEVDSIWFFGTRSHDTKIVKFDKDSNKYSTNIIPIRFMPIPHNAFSKPSEFIWAFSFTMDERTIYRINKIDLNVRTIHPPDGVMIDFFSPSYSDDDTVWIGATKHRNLPPFMNNVPYLIKIRKTDLNAQLVLVKPTWREAIGATFESFKNWLLVPFYFAFGGKT